MFGSCFRTLAVILFLILFFSYQNLLGKLSLLLGGVPLVRGAGSFLFVGRGLPLDLPGPLTGPQTTSAGWHLAVWSRLWGRATADGGCDTFCLLPQVMENSNRFVIWDGGERVMVLKPLPFSVELSLICWLFVISILATTTKNTNTPPPSTPKICKLILRTTEFLFLCGI